MVAWWVGVKQQEVGAKVYIHMDTNDVGVCRYLDSLSLTERKTTQQVKLKSLI